MITPSGARKILAGLRLLQYDLSSVVIDCAIMMAIMRSSDIVGYVAKTHRYYSHAETMGDTRISLNGGYGG